MEYCACTTHTEHKRCYNNFKYQFTRQSESIVHTAGIVSYCGPFDTCPCSAAQKHQAGDGVPCWQPAAGKTKADLESFYGCPNDMCIKIVDPKGKEDEKNERG